MIIACHQDGDYHLAQQAPNGESNAGILPLEEIGVNPADIAADVPEYGGATPDDLAFFIGNTVYVVAIRSDAVLGQSLAELGMALVRAGQAMIQAQPTPLAVVA